MSESGGRSINGGNNETFETLTVTGLSTLNTGTFNSLTGSANSTIYAHTGNFDNISGPVSQNQILLKDTVNNNYGKTLIISNNTAIAGDISEGLHEVWNNSAKISSIYACDDSNLCTDLYLNKPIILTPAPVHAPSFKCDTITEETTNGSVQISGGVKFLNDSKTIRNSVDDIVLDANNATNNIVRLQSGSADKFTIGPTQNTSNQNLIMGTNSLNFGSGQCILNNNSLNMTSANFDAVRISTVGSGGSEWIGLSAGLTGVAVQRFVAGNLNNVATIGGHLTSGSGIGYDSWADLNINNANGANVHIQNSNYTSANALSVGGSVDVQTGYKINNAAQITYAGGGVANTFVLPGKAGGTWTIALTADIIPPSYKQSLFFTSNGTLVGDWYFGPQGMTSSESNFSWVANKTATFNFLRVKLSGGPGSDTFTFTVRINGVDTALSVSITGSTTFGINLVSSVNIAAGDLYSVKFTTTGGVPSVLGYLTFDMTS